VFDRNKSDTMRRSAAAPLTEAADGVAAAGKTFSIREVARHNTPEDCWLLVHGRIYDVTAWVPQHPGGALIYVKAGGDCSQLFDAYHPLSAR
jgi:cytochrome b involved in lipid metabolism